MNIIWDIPETFFMIAFGITLLAILFYTINVCKSLPRFLKHAKGEKC